ncbi:restriction endonuclease subunit S [Actinosynnema sp. NPDC004786]
MVSQAANQESGLDWSRTRFHSYEGNPRKLKGYLEPGDSLVNSTGTGTLGRVGRFDSQPDSRPCVADGHVTIVRFDPRRMDARFGYYYLKSNLFQEFMFETLVTGSTNQIELSCERMRATPVPAPSLTEQRRIADFLDVEISRIDNLCALRSRMNSLLSLRRARVIDQEILAFGQLVPLRYRVKSVGVGIVVTPASWYVANGGIPALRGVNVKAGRIDQSNLVHISNEGHALNRKSRLDTGDVVVVRTGQAGTAAVVPTEMSGANCIDLVIIKPSKQLYPKFLEYVLNSDYAYRFIAKHSVGTIQSHFNVSAMKQIPIPSPPVFEQRSTVERLNKKIEATDILRANMEDQIKALKERRQALITAAVTGGLDVTTARSGVR